MTVLSLTVESSNLNIRPVFETKTSNSPLVQLVERWTVNPYVASSSLARGAIFSFFTEKVTVSDLLPCINLHSNHH
ncbi:protein of unknown function [Moritella yayanosii]|uniref:Uncharacterized protein n=1 Tax=Moritella yayanosii TaxID=69539 RepID=A0A330LM38_9GAMM|nr:protein of unknown function [Moritella yayanosii]